MELKAEVWDRVMEFATLLASEDWTERYWRNYNALRDYCEAQSLGGYNHPFLWESLPDANRCFRSLSSQIHEKKLSDRGQSSK